MDSVANCGLAEFGRPVALQSLLAEVPGIKAALLPEAARARLITGLASPESAAESDLVLVAQRKVLLSAVQSRAAGFLVSSELLPDLKKLLDGAQERVVLEATPAEWVAAELVSRFWQRTPLGPSGWPVGVHPTAVIHPTAELAPSCQIAPCAVIGERVKIGDGVSIGPHSFIDNDATIAQGSVIHAFVHIAPRVVIGKDCEIHPHTSVGKEGFGYAHDARFNHRRIPHQGSVVLGDRVHLGAGVTIDRGTFGDTVIESGVIIDNQVHIAHNCRIGENSILTSGFGVAGSTKIGKRFIAGGASGVTGHIEIVDDVHIAAFSGVGKAITRPGDYGGNPLLPYKEFVRMKVALTKLPGLLKLLAQRGLLGAEKESSDSL